jgi:hypothetical protein
MPFTTLWRKWAQRRDAAEAARRQEAYFLDAIERMVQESDPSIRSQREYRRQLSAPVRHALAYIDGLVAAVPPPVALAPELWDRTPLARALFVGPHEIDPLLQGAAELDAFFRARPRAGRATAILTATMRERTVFGTAMEGEIVRRDVPQTAVEFVDLRVVAPAGTEAEARQELRVRTLQLLAAHALKHMLELRSLREELAEQRRILEIKLKIQQSRPDGLECALSAECPAGERADPAGQVLEEIDRRLMELPPDAVSARAHLDHLVATLNHPEKTMRARAFALNLNWMGVKQAPADGAGGAGAVRLAEVEIENRLKRVAVLVQVPRPGPGV